MSFISQSACNGSMPRHLAAFPSFDRTHLLSSMMRNRGVPRYLCAPFGFGKTSLACSYAELVDRFVHTYWFDGSHPCFLRDLDAQTLLPDLVSEGDAGDLVVIDNLPAMSEERSVHLWKLCEGLIHEGREVVVASTPSANPLRGHEEACVCIGPADLLYGESDWEQLAGAGVARRPDVPRTHPVGNIALLVSDKREGVARFLHEHVLELGDVPEVALSFALLALERGELADVSLMVGREIEAKDVSPHCLRPFVWMDEYGNDFSAVGFPLVSVMRVFEPHLPRIAAEMGAADANELAMRFADFFVACGNPQRAQTMLMHACDPRHRSTWLAQNQETLLNQCALVTAEVLYASLRTGRLRDQPQLHAASCVRRALLVPGNDAFEGVRSVARRDDYPLACRLDAALHAYLLIEDSGMLAEFETAFAAELPHAKHEAKDLAGVHRFAWRFFEAAAEDPFDYEAFAASLRAKEEGALALACCVHKARMKGKGVCDLPRLAQTTRKLLGRSGACHKAGLSLLAKEAVEFGLAFEPDAFPASSAFHDAVTFTEGLASQKALYARSKAAQTAAASTALHAQLTQSALLSARARTTTPVMSARLFGGFEVRVGERSVPTRAFKRQKARVLLALMVLEGGHEFSCESLAERLWPDSKPFQAQHNFNNCIYLLRQQLQTNDKECPYIVRSQGVVSVDETLVESDASMLKAMCDHLRFADPDPETFYSVLERVRSLYRGDLFPSECNEPMIISAREEWRNRIVNALMHASRKLSGTGETWVSLQMAEQALAYAPQREDCYELLMETQAASGQRPGAVKTWLRYCTFLSEEMGLDPSPRASKLYERIINEEP